MHCKRFFVLYFLQCILTQRILLLFLFIKQDTTKEYIVYEYHKVFLDIHLLGHMYSFMNIMRFSYIFVYYVIFIYHNRKIFMIFSYQGYLFIRYLRVTRSHFMKQNADFQEGISQAQSTATPQPTLKFLTTNKIFQMGYYIRILLKGHQNGQRTKFQTSNFT